LLVALTLLAIIRFFGIEVDSFLAGLAAIAWLLTALVLRPSNIYTPELRFAPTRLVTSVFVRWFVLVIALMAIGYLSGLSRLYPRRVILPWAVISPFVASVTLLALQMMLRRIALSIANQRNAVIVGVNQSSISLANKLTQHPEFCSNILGFFEDRGVERLEPLGRFSVIGKLGELATYVRRERVDCGIPRRPSTTCLTCSFLT
jgi:putative colanic acid biosynthesis UDP-glucose lipid carrier transferase